MSSKWIKKGDKVLVTAGNDKGLIGEVLARKEGRIIVQGVNVRKKHVKKREQSPGGEIASIERPIHISNVALCDADGTKIKLKTRLTTTGKELFYLKEGKETDFRTIKKSGKEG